MKNKIKIIKRSTGTPSEAEKAGRGLRALGSAGVMTLKKLWNKLPEKGLLSGSGTKIKDTVKYLTSKQVTLSDKAPFVKPVSFGKKLGKVYKASKVLRLATPIGAASIVASGLGTYEKGKDPQSLAKKAYEKGKSYKVAKEFKTYGADGVKTVKKKLGGMNKSKLKKAAMMGTALLASNYLGKRAGENAVIDSINSGQAFKPEGAKRTAFGVSLNDGGEVEIVKGQDYIKDLL